jgi:O-methyltransferase
VKVNQLIPDTIRIPYHKLRWFKRNYEKIHQRSELKKEKHNHFHGPITYDTDSLKTSNNCDFIKEPRFATAYAAAAATQPWEGFTLQWRTYIVCWFADLVKNLEGDFVECGVNTGAYSKAVITYINFNHLNKTFYLLDTFEGMIEDLVSEAEKKAGVSAYFGSYKDVYEQVKNTFKEDKVKIIKGAVPGTLPECTTQKIAYLSIDMNCVAPEIAAAEYFWDKIVPGGVMILDDYGFPQHINQKIAFDEFAKEKGIAILCLPTAQGIIFKPTR